MNLMENEKLPDVEDKTVIDFESLLRRIIIDTESWEFSLKGYLTYDDYTQQEKDYILKLSPRSYFYDRKTGKDYP